MRYRTLTLAGAALATTLVLASVPAPLLAQEQEGGEAQPEESQSHVAELQQIQGQLMQIRERAMEDQKLQEQQAELQRTITSTMKEIDPEVETKMARVNEIQQEMREAQQAGEQETVGELMQEAQSIQQELTQTQQEAMGREDVEQAVDQFREQLFDKMREVDPEADGLIERAQELTAQLQEQQSGG